MDIILKLLDWPFLFFVGAGLLIYTFKAELGKVIARGGITLNWGDKSFEISELPEQLNESFAPVADDIEEMKKRLSVLEEALKLNEAKTADVKSSELGAEVVESARQRMLKALESGQYRWRSIERLSSAAGLSVAQASEILRPMKEVVFSRGKSGRTIVRLESR